MPKKIHASFKIFLLGAPRVEWGERPLASKRRNVRGLLYWLAADLEFIPRGSLYFLFWPDEPDLNARRNLFHLSTHLRLALPEMKTLLTTEDMVGLDTQAVWCDVVAFSQFLHGDRCDVDLRCAVELYRGSFLTGFSLPNSSEYEQWASRERSSLETL